MTGASAKSSVSPLPASLREALERESVAREEWSCRADLRSTGFGRVADGDGSPHTSNAPRRVWPSWDRQTSSSSTRSLPPHRHPRTPLDGCARAPYESLRLSLAPARFARGNLAALLGLRPAVLASPCVAHPPSPVQSRPETVGGVASTRMRVLANRWTSYGSDACGRDDGCVTVNRRRSATRSRESPTDLPQLRWRRGYAGRAGRRPATLGS